MMPPWVHELIGIPFKERGRTREGLDCWGCVREGLRVGFDLDVPSYSEEYATTQDRDEIAALIRREVLTDWRPVRVSEAQLGDVLVLRIAGEPWHCGLVIELPLFLHCVRGANSCLERWDQPLWRHRISGVYRHIALCRVAVMASISEVQHRSQSSARAEA